MTHTKRVSRASVRGPGRSVLRDTKSDRRMGRAEIKAQVRASCRRTILERWIALLTLPPPPHSGRLSTGKRLTSSVSPRRASRLSESMATLEVEERGLQQVVSDRVCRAWEWIPIRKLPAKPRTSPAGAGSIPSE